MHRARFGSLVAAFLKNSPTTPETAAFAAGMATHAVLDRCWHPYIVYHAGWVIPGQPATRRLRRCHAFLERVLDVLLAKHLDVDVRVFDFFSSVHVGEEFPKSLKDGLVTAIQHTYPRAHDPETDRARVSNAYRDSLRFFAMTDPRNPGFRRRAMEMEECERSGSRRLALFHPVVIDYDVDWANESRRCWCHPCNHSEKSTASIFDLFDQALSKVGPLLHAVLAASQGRTGFAAVAKEIGDHGLNLTQDGSRCTPSICDPLPVADLLDAQYLQ